MAFPQSGEGKERPEAGQILIVIREWTFVWLQAWVEDRNGSFRRNVS